MRAVPTSRPKPRWRWLAAALIGIGTLAPSAAPTVRAHDLQVTHATLRFTPGRYQLDVVVDPESLLARLELYADRTPSTGVPASEIPARIQALLEVALMRTAIAFDGVPTPSTVQFLPTAEGLPEPLREGLRDRLREPLRDKLRERHRARRRRCRPGRSASLATCRLARAHCRVTYGLVLGSYALTLVSPTGQRSAPIWIAGGRPSADLDLPRGLRRPALVVDGPRVRRPRLHTHPAQGPRPHPVRGRPVPARHALASAAGAGHPVHDRALGDARPVDARRRVTAVVDRRAADCLLDRLRRGREPVHDRAVALAWRRSSSCSACCTAWASPACSASSACRPDSSAWRWSRSTSASKLGQLTVIGLATLAVGWWRLSRRETYRRWVVVPVSLAIALVGLYWTATRALG